MKEYPSIDRDVRVGEKIYAFDKLDGNNIRVEWDRKKKFWKFGTRTQMLDASDKLYGEAVGLVVNKYEQVLHDIFKHEQFEKVIAFFEYWGKNSFAGVHVQEPHDVTLIDISVHKKGILPPPDYLKLFRDVEKARLLYYGNANQPFVELVKESRLEGMTFEGVVCKGQIVTPGMPLMFKVKSLAWINRLKEKCNGDMKLFENLV